MAHIVKVFYNNDEEVRKFQFNFNEGFAALQRKISSAFQKEGLLIHWRDHEGDLIRITTDSDLMLMLSERPVSLEQSGTSDVKLYALLPGTSTTGASSTSSEGHSSATATDEMLHVGVTCDVCNTSPIRGNRFKCIECPNFDLCDACFQRGEHSHHNMILMRRPPPPLPLPFFMRGGGAPWCRGRGGWRPGCPRQAPPCGPCPRQASSSPCGPCPRFAGPCSRFSGPCPPGPKSLRTENTPQQTTPEKPTDPAFCQTNNSNPSGEEMGWSFVDNMFHALGAASSAFGGAPSAPQATMGQAAGQATGQTTGGSSLPEHVAASLNVMLQMGYNDENGWLSNMLLRHDGDISLCLDEIRKNCGPTA